MSTFPFPRSLMYSTSLVSLQVDVKCTTAASGGHYYRDHLPLLKEHVLVRSLSQGQCRDGRLKVGDKVIVQLDVDIIKQMAEGHGGWTPAMEKVLIYGRSLPSSSPSFLPPSLPSFLPSLPSFLSSLPPCFPSFFPSFRPSCNFLLSSIPSLLPFFFPSLSPFTLNISLLLPSFSTAFDYICLSIHPFIHLHYPVITSITSFESFLCSLFACPSSRS